MKPVRARKLCGWLKERLDQGSFKTEVHSVFRSAANLSAPFGLVTLLAPGKGLQPASITLSSPMDFDLLREHPLILSPAGLYGGENLFVNFSQSTIVIDLQMTALDAALEQSIFIVRAFLEENLGRGLTSLVPNQPDNPFAEFLAPRFEEFRRAVWKPNRKSIVYTVRRIAGCGPGLTPSSDDWICGYLAALPEKKTQNGFAMLVAETAAERTNDISANLLRWSGQRYFSEDILRLKQCLSQDGTPSEHRDALQKVADFGSSSGFDFLTGFYFGLLDTNLNWRDTN